MNKKAMELPLSTIVTIAIVLFVLIAVGMMFFQQFSQSQTQGFDQGQCISICQTAKSAHAAKLPIGLCSDDVAADNYCKSCDATCTLAEGVTLTCDANKKASITLESDQC